MEKLIRIDLGETEIPQPCEKHRKPGVQADCEACADAPPIPGEIPELKGIFAEFRNPNMIPYGELKALLAIRDGEMMGQYKERIVAALVTAWNVKDAETGEELPIPAGNTAVLDRAIDVVTPVYDAVLKARRERAVPKGSTTSS